MRILFINSFYHPIVYGGAERTLRTLVEGLIARNHEVEVISLRPGQAGGPNDVGHSYSRHIDIKNVYFPSVNCMRNPLQKAVWHSLDIYNPFYRKALGERLEDFSPDVVSCHNLSGFSSSVWRDIRSRGIPIVQVLHDYYPCCLRAMRSKRGSACHTQCIECSILKWPAKLASKNVDSVVGISDHILSVFNELNYFPNANIKTTIHNAERAPESSGTSFRKSREITFGFIGTIVPHKGLHVLLDAMQAQGELPSSRLLVAGDGDPRYLEQLKSKYSSSRVNFLGRTNAADFFPTLDCLVVPSLSDEPLGRVAFEALAHGVPIFASRRGGLKEIVRDGVNGWLFEPGNAAELCRLMSLFANQEIKFSRGEVMKSGEHFYDVNRFVQSYEALYGDTVRRFRENFPHRNNPQTDSSI
ncbi:glycosyltransferase family 4 protein [Qipengyuania aquimaris]|uniref:Glycosyltransferase family 4 protein n=1 Tax=Qipengyuania aquimaris TaxID=255984 RepID=A0A9Q3XDH8_9SPHN|nr:glycosyltransferase family 4 protein [Qipengyuania aquimaris]